MWVPGFPETGTDSAVHTVVQKEAVKGAERLRFTVIAPPLTTDGSADLVAFAAAVGLPVDFFVRTVIGRFLWWMVLQRLVSVVRGAAWRRNCMLCSSLSRHDMGEESMQMASWDPGNC